MKWPETKHNYKKTAAKLPVEISEKGIPNLYVVNLTFATALGARRVEYGLQPDPVACVVSKLLTPSCILPVITHG